MTETKPFTNLQLTTLVFLRLLIGWHLLYEGISKLLTPGWSSIGFLRESQWIMSGFAEWIASNSSVLSAVDFLNTWGLIAIGLGLILGLCTRIAAISGALLLLMYYFNNAPITGIEYSIPAEGNNLIVSKTLIEAVALFVIAVFPTGSIIGLDALITRFKSKNIKKNRK
jgi:thiosulfate dehydrogenase [quinone] large subunit